MNGIILSSVPNSVWLNVTKMSTGQNCAGNKRKTACRQTRTDYRPGCTYVHLFGFSGICLLETPYRIRYVLGLKRRPGLTHSSGADLADIEHDGTTLISLNSGFPRLS